MDAPSRGMSWSPSCSATAPAPRRTRVPADQGRLISLKAPRNQSRSGAPSGKRGRNGRASSTARAKDGRASNRVR